MNKGLRWKETIAGVEAPNLMVVETQLPAGRNQTFATAADIVQCLKANPEALTPEQWAEVLRDYPEVKRYCIAQTFLGSEGYWVSCEARASRAEQALATVTAERDDAMTLAEERRDYARAQNAKLSVECDDLRAQLTAVERERDAARSELEVARNPKHPDAVAWMKHLEGCDVLPGGTYAPVFLSSVSRLFTERDAALAKLAEVERERDEAHAALRDCATRLGNGSAVSPKASHAFHCAVATEVGIVVPALRAKLAKTERVVEAARQHLRCDLTDTESISAEHALQNALRALDSPVVAGTDSGGSGAATPEGGHAAPTGGPMPPPEPAGISHDPPPAEAPRCAACKRYPGPGNAAACADMKGFPFAPDEDCACRCHATPYHLDPEAPATRAELDELRRRVERLENLTGSGSGSGSG